MVIQAGLGNYMIGEIILIAREYVDFENADVSDIYFYQCNFSTTRWTDGSIVNSDPT